VLDLSDAELVSRFRADLQEGMPTYDEPGRAAARSGVQAGVLKLGIGYWRINAFERRVAEAVAATHAATGAPVMVHTEHATAAHEVLDLLDGMGVAPTRVALAHVDRNPDPGLHAELASRGCFLGYDGAARARFAPESALLACLADLVAAGHAHAVLLGGDVARAGRFRSYGGLPGMDYLGRRFVPRVRQAVGADVTDLLLRGNPQRWLANAATLAG
jgi:phosphotriesterase-related protein